LHVENQVKAEDCISAFTFFKRIFKDIY
jgi:hypothetical protein